MRTGTLRCNWTPTIWIPTVPGKNWFAYFRFYQPTEAYFDRSWPLPDYEQV